MKKLLYITKPCGNCDYDEIEFHSTKKAAEEDARVKSLAPSHRGYTVIALGKDDYFGTNKAEWELVSGWKNGFLTFGLPY